MSVDAEDSIMENDNNDITGDPGPSTCIYTQPSAHHQAIIAAKSLHLREGHRVSQVALSDVMDT